MIPLIIWALIFVLSVFVLIKAADYFTASAEKIGIHFGIPAFIVGVTIVSIGTSLPELLTSLIAVLKGSSEIVISNIVGSNITNIFLVLGIAAIIGKNLKITYDIAKIDLPLLVASTLFLFACAIDGKFTLIEIILCLVGFFIYLFYTINIEKKNKDKQIKKELNGILLKRKLQFKVWAILILSAGFIYLGSNYVVESVINLSKILNIGTDVIVASVVALGTSLPELVVSVTAASKGKPEMAIGNILGSNIFNSLAIIGIVGLFGNLIIPVSILTLGLPLMLLATLLFLFMTQDKIVSQWEGWFLILFYAFYIGKLFALF
jgi:cation:H+ antiporter